MENHAPDEHEACCGLPAAARTCPDCAKRGRTVGRETLDRQLAPDARAKFGDVAGFCANPDCAVVYFSGGAIVRKGETLRAVTQKDPGDEVNVCYCFDFKRGDIRRDLAARSVTDIPVRIKHEIDAGRCDCERMNPQGACCLGNVAAEVKRLAAERKTRA